MKLFTDHPHSVGESYGEHLKVATSFGWPLLKAGCACILHGIFPFLFAKTGSQTIVEQHNRLVAQRGRNEARENFDPAI